MADRSRTRESRDPKAEGTDPQNDRERIAAALVELSGRGYNTAMFAPWDICCGSCGWTEVRRQFGVPEDTEPEDDSWALGKRVIWWHEQADALAFAGDADFVLHTDEFLARIPDEEHEAEEWFDQHMQEVMADTVTARTTKYVDLRSALQLHWLGDPDEIVAALRAQGLRAMRPSSADECIAVLPKATEFGVSVSTGEVVLSIDGYSSVLAPAAARRLARKLTAAAKNAEAEALPDL